LCLIKGELQVTVLIRVGLGACQGSIILSCLSIKVVLWFNRIHRFFGGRAKIVRTKVSAPSSAQTNTKTTFTACPLDSNLCARSSLQRMEWKVAGHSVGWMQNAAATKRVVAACITRPQRGRLNCWMDQKTPKMGGRGTFVDRQSCT